MKRSILILLLAVCTPALAQQQTLPAQQQANAASQLTPANPHKTLTVKQFLRLPKGDTTSYAVRGVVTKLGSSSRGSFHIKDRSGSLYIYGILDPVNPKRPFRQMDIVQGDTVTVLGRFDVYNGTKEMKDGRLLAKSDGPDHNLSLKERLEQKPSFKGKEGDEAIAAFRQWCQGQIRQPSDGASGKVQVKFVVGRNGKVQEVQINKGATAAMNEEAMRVVRSSPKWKPARISGDAIRCNCYVTLVFGD